MKFIVKKCCNSDKNDKNHNDNKNTIKIIKKKMSMIMIVIRSFQWKNLILAKYL